MGRTKAVSNDIRKVGTQSYRDLQQLNALNYSLAARNLQRRYGNEILTVKPAPRLSYLDYLWSGPVASPILTQSGGRDWVGNSIWDRSEYSLSDIDVMRENPNELRAYDQPWYALIGSGAVKMLGLAGSTFLNSTIGVITGLTQGFVNLADNKSFWEGMWNNAFTAGVEEFNRSMEEWMPNYYTLKELQGPWYENVFTANFLGDKILKNMGFTIGAIGAAYVTGGLGLGTLAGKGLLLLGAGAKAAEFGGGIINRIINGLLSATGEATVEAYNSVHDGMEKYNKELDAYTELQARALLEKRDEDIENGISPEIAEQQYLQGLLQLDINRSKALQEYMKTLTDHGNAVFGMNIAALTISNNLEFGRAMKGGWGTQSMLESMYKKGSKDIARTIDGKVIGNTVADDVAFGKAMAKGTAKYQLIKTENPSKWLLATGAIKNGLSEGGEEGIQRIISDTNQMRSQAIAQKESRRKGYIDHALDPKITDAMVNYSDALNHAWLESFGDASKSGWEEVALGALTGILGVPTLGRRKSGNLGLTWQGGFAEDYREAKLNRKDVEQQVDMLNLSIDRTKLRNRVYRATADVAINQGQRKSLFENDHLLFKHLLVAGAVNTALNIRDNLDGGEAFRSMVEEMSLNISDLDVAEYKQAIAAQYGVDEKEVFAGKTNDEIKQQMSKDISSFNKLLNKTIENYDKLSKDKRVKDKIEGLAFDELLHSYTLAQNIGERIQLIETRNELLNLGDPVEKEEYEDNIKDLAKLKEDKKYFDQRVENALKNPEQFSKLVETKVANYNKAYGKLLTNQQTEALKNATTMEEVAQTLSPLSFELREAILENALKEANELAKKAILNYIKFQDDAYNVLYVIEQALNQYKEDLDKGDKIAALKANERLNNLDKEYGQQTGRYSISETILYLEDLYRQRRRLLRGDDVNQTYTEKQDEEDVTGLWADTEFMYELLNNMQQQLAAGLQGAVNTENAANLPLMIEALQQIIPIAEETGSSIREKTNKYNNMVDSITKLIEAVYQDIVFRDNIGLNTSIADAIKNTIDTLEKDMSISPAVKDVLLRTLDGLKDNEKLQSVRDAIKLKKDEFAEKRKSAKKELNKQENTATNNTENTTNNTQQQNAEDTEESIPEDMIIMTVALLFDYLKNKLGVNITPNPRILNLGLKITVSPNDANYNETFPNYSKVYEALIHLNDVNKEDLAKVFDGSYNNDERMKDYVEFEKDKVKTLLQALDLGFVLRDSLVPEIMKTLNIALNEEMAQWFTNYKGNDSKDDNTGGTKADNKIPEGEENHQKIAVKASDFAGNQIHEFDMLNDNKLLHVLHRLDYGALSEMFEDGIHTQWFIDNILGNIFVKKPDIKVRFMTSGKNNVYLALDYEEVKQFIPQTNEASIVEANNKRYVVIGTCGYLKDDNGNAINQEEYTKLRDKLKEGFDKKNNNSKFYVDDKLFTNITNVTGGEFITTTDTENHEVYRTLKSLLENSNPHKLKASDLDYLVIMGNEEDFVYTALVPKEGRDGRLYRDTGAKNTGAVYVYIPTGRANEWIPVMLKSVSWKDMLSNGLINDFKASTFYKNNILSRINTLLTSTDNVEKIKVIAQLKNDLIFSKHRTLTGKKDALNYNEETGTVLYLDENDNWVDITSEKQFIEVLEKLNPRISINKGTLETTPELYINSGILLTNVKTLGTMKSTFYVRGLDTDLNLLEAQERTPEKYNYHPQNTRGILYFDRATYFEKADGLYDEQGNKLSDEQTLELRELYSVILTGDRFKDKNRRYIISKDKKTVYLHANRSYTKLTAEKEYKAAVKAYEKLLEAQEKKLNREQNDNTIEKVKNNRQLKYGTIIDIPVLHWVRKDGSDTTEQATVPIFSQDQRKIVVVDMNGIKVPFYLSTGTGGKKNVKAGKWYPFFGISEQGWINKTTEDEINNYYGSDILRETALELDEKIGDIRNDNTLFKGAATGPHIDLINSEFEPVENNLSDTKEKVLLNINKLRSKLEQSVLKQPVQQPDKRDNKGFGNNAKDDSKEGLDNPENNDNFAAIKQALQPYKLELVDSDWLYEKEDGQQKSNAEKLFGMTEDEAADLSNDAIIEMLAKKLNNSKKGIKPADLTTLDDIKKAIDDILHC